MLAFTEFVPRSADRFRLELLAQDVGEVLASRRRDDAASMLETLAGFAQELADESTARAWLDALIGVVDAFVTSLRVVDMHQQQLVVARQDTHRRILTYLEPKGVCLAAEISGDLKIPKATVSEALARLRDAALVQRWNPPVPIDARQDPHRLTAAGEACLAELGHASPAVSVSPGIRELLEFSTRNLPEVEARSDRVNAHVLTVAVVGAVGLLAKPKWKAQEARAAQAYCALLDASAPDASRRFDAAVSGPGDAPLARADRKAFSLLRSVAFPDLAQARPIRHIPEPLRCDAVAFPAWLMASSLLGPPDMSVLDWLAKIEVSGAILSPASAALDALIGYWGAFLKTRLGESDGSSWGLLASAADASPGHRDPASRIVRRLCLSARLNQVTVPFQSVLERETLQLVELHNPRWLPVFTEALPKDAALDAFIAHSHDTLALQVRHLRSLSDQAPLRHHWTRLSDEVRAVQSALDSELDLADFFDVTTQLRESVECLSLTPAEAEGLSPAPTPTPELRRRIRAERAHDLTPLAVMPTMARSLRNLRRPPRSSAPQVQSHPPV